MIVEGLEQNTPEWLLWRRSYIGASDASVIAGKNKYKTIQYLWRDKLGLNPTEAQSVPARRGHDLEPVARQLYEDEYSVKVPSTTFISDDISFLSASVDGYNADLNFIIEIKCPMRKTAMRDAFNGKINPEHYPQLQHQLFVTRASYVDYVVFDGLNTIIVQRVEPDLKYQRKLVRLERWFWAQVQNKKEIERYGIRIDATKSSSQ